MEIKKTVSRDRIISTFISGGVQEGRIQNIEGDISNDGSLFGMIYPGATRSGAFTYGIQRTRAQQYNINTTSYDLGFDASLSVKTGPDVAGINLSTRLWRRVS
jgi:hypothetical protein